MRLFTTVFSVDVLALPRLPEGSLSKDKKNDKGIVIEDFLFVIKDLAKKIVLFWDEMIKLTAADPSLKNQTAEMTGHVNVIFDWLNRLKSEEGISELLNALTK